MKRKLLSLLLALVLALSLRPAALAAEPEDAEFSGTFLRTSYSERNYLELRIEGGMLQISGVLSSSNADIMLDSTLESAEALKGYAVHPAHVAVANGVVRPYTEVRTCLDFEV